MEVWFTDEARVGQQGTLSPPFSDLCLRPGASRDRRYEWAYLFGAVCPERSTGAAIIMPEVNVEAMNKHLAEISRSVSVGAMVLLVPGWCRLAQLAALEGAAQRRAAAASALFMFSVENVWGVPPRPTFLPTATGIPTTRSCDTWNKTWNQ